jgi:hypothetical protein
MASRSGEVKELLTSVPAFVSYHATRDGDTVTSVTVYNDDAGCDESTRRAGINRAPKSAPYLFDLASFNSRR